MIKQIANEINENNNKHRVKNIEKCTLPRLSEALGMSKQCLYKMLTLDKSGRPQKTLSLLNIIRIIVVLRPTMDQAYELIARAGYCIAYDYDPNVAIYREIISNLRSDCVDDHNRRLEKVVVAENKPKEVFFLFARLDGYQQ